MKTKSLESLAANEFTALEMTEIKGGRTSLEEDSAGLNIGCPTYSGNCVAGCACQLEQ